MPQTPKSYTPKEQRPSVLVIGHSLGADIECVEWDSPEPNVADYDVVIMDLTTAHMTQLPPPQAYSVQPRLHQVDMSKYLQWPHIRRSVGRLLLSGGRLFVITDPEIVISPHSARVVLHRARSKTLLPFMPFGERVPAGQPMKWVDPRFDLYFQEVGQWNFSLTGKLECFYEYFDEQVTCQVHPLAKNRADEMIALSVSVWGNKSKMPGVVYILPPPTRITSAEAIELLIARLDNLREAPLQHAEEVQAALFSPTSPLAATRSQQATRTQPSVTVTWLHLSDLHFRASQAYDTNIVLRALLRDVAERIEQDGLHPDFIVVTGDIAFAGQPAEYALARPFFDDLLKTTGLSCERLFIVPGNHDVDRNLVSRGAQGIGDSLNDRHSTNSVLATPGDRQLMFVRFRGYATFVNDYLSGHLTFDDDHYFYVRRLDLAGQQIALLGLNSAWLCASDQDRAKGLLVGERQTRTALERAEGATLKIAVLHHPFDWLREFDQNDSAAMLLDNCDFVLHGHLHQTAATRLISPDGAATVLACGACYETRDFPNMYNWVRLDLSAGTGTVCLRRYSDARGGFWAKDTLTYKNVPDGKYTFALRSGWVPPSSLRPPRPAVELGGPMPIERMYSTNGPRPTPGLHIDPDHPPIAAIRDLLIAAFTAEDLRRFCQERRAFRSVVSKFGPGHGLDDMADQVIDHCQNHLLWDELLAEVALARPRQYDHFEPRLRGQS